MGVCFVTKDYQVPILEGHRILANNTIKCAIDTGIKNTVLSVDTYSNGANEKASGNLTRVHLPFRHAGAFSGGTITNDTLSNPLLLEAIAVPLIVRKLDKRCNIVHLLAVPKELYGASVDLLQRRNVLMHYFHVPSSYGTFLYSIRHALVRINSSLFVGTSTKLLRENLLSMGVASERVHYIPVPIWQNNQFSSKNLARSILGLPLEKTIIAYIGAIAPQRGLFDFLDAAASCNDSETIFLISHPGIIYRDLAKSYLEMLISEIRRRALGRRVLLIGPQPLNVLFDAVDVVVLPFRDDYFFTAPPLVLLEAMSTGVPVVTTRVNATADIASENRVFLAKASCPSSLCCAIARATDKGYAAQVGVSEKRFIAENHSPQVVAASMVHAYESILRN